MKWIIEQANMAFDAQAASWQRIVDEHYSSTPALSSPFISMLIQHYAGNNTILATATDEGGNIAHLILEKSGFGRWVTLSTPQAILGTAVFSNSRHHKEDLLASLTKALPGLCLHVIITRQDSDLTHWQTLHDQIEIKQQSTTISVNLNESFDEFWSQRKRKLRNNLKRYLKRLDNDGYQVTLEVLSSHDEVITGVTEHGLLESKGWKGKQGTAIHPDSKDGAFYGDLFGEFSKPSHAKIYRLLLNDSLLASRMLLTNENIMISLKITYDEEFATYAPGRVLQYYFLKDVFERRDVKKVEFYTRADNDKIQWATDSRAMFLVSVYRYGFIRNLIKMTRFIKRKMRSFTR